MHAPTTVRGHDGPIGIDPASRSVTKTYQHADYATALGMAEREADHAARFHAALAAERGIRCPGVISIDRALPPRVTFQWCDGEALQPILLRSAPAPTGALARAIGRGLRIYVRVFDEPYRDLHLNNLLYDASTGVVTFLDFAFPERLRGKELGTPVEASLANLLGCACYELSRPSALLASRDATLALVGALLDGFAHEASIGRIRERAEDIFLGLCGAGSPMRIRYYGTLGRLIGRRCLAQIA